MEDTGWTDRTALLLGDANMEKLRSASVLVMGLGGVGAYAAEMLVRAGIGKICIVDGDEVSLTNLNRQLPALHSTLGQSKAGILKARFLDINPELEIEAMGEYVKDQRMVEILESRPFDYVVDAIDTLSPKIYLLYHCVKRKMRVVSAMGSGGKADPLQLKICDISQTYHCALADALRKRLHKLNIYTGIQAVFSPEPVPAHAVRKTFGERNKKSMVGTVSYMPPLVGCLCASVVIRELCGERVVSDLPVPLSVRRKIAETEKFPIAEIGDGARPLKRGSPDSMSD